MGRVAGGAAAKLENLVAEPEVEKLDAEEVGGKIA